MEPMILDNRDQYTSIRAPEILGRLLPHIDRGSLSGIGQIILLDEDPLRKRSKSSVSARYHQLGNTKRGNVLIFFSHLEHLEAELKKNELYVAYLLARSLAHELYHHSVRAQRIRRRPKKDAEERDARNFSQSVATHVAHALFPKSKYPKLWDSMKEALERRKVNANPT